MKKADRFPS